MYSNVKLRINCVFGKLYLNKKRKISDMFQENLKTLMRRWDLSNRKLGDLLGVKSSNVDTLRRGVTKPSVQIILAIESLTGIPARELYNSKLDIIDFPKQPILSGTGSTDSALSNEPFPGYDPEANVGELSLENFLKHIENLSKDLAQLRQEFDDYRQESSTKNKN